MKAPPRELELRVVLKMRADSTAGALELSEYVADAIKSYYGCYSPDDPVFGVIKTVQVFRKDAER